jgi:GDP-4-dehydro-6-deoxy-D-mannose reductase
MRVLITGVSGFLGPHLVRALLERGAQVAGAYLGPAPELPDVELLEIELSDLQGLERFVRQTRPEAVIHLAGLSHVGGSWKRIPHYYQVNFLGTENVLRAASDCRVLFASSSEVYGRVPEEEQPLSEDRRLEPSNPYAMTKAAAERLVVGQDGIVVRCFNLAGPGQAPEFALPAFAAQLREIGRGVREPVLRVGNLEARRDFVHVADAAEAFCLILERGESGGVYNIATGTACSIGEALERLLGIAAVEARVEVDPARLRPTDIPVLRGDASRLRALGWRPRSTLDAALRDLWEATLSE